MFGGERGGGDIMTPVEGISRPFFFFFLFYSGKFIIHNLGFEIAGLPVCQPQNNAKTFNHEKVLVGLSTITM